MDEYKTIIDERIKASDGSLESRLEVYNAVRRQVFEMPLGDAPGQAREAHDNQILAVIEDAEKSFSSTDIRQLLAGLGA